VSYNLYFLELSMSERLTKFDLGLCVHTPRKKWEGRVRKSAKANLNRLVYMCDQVRCYIYFMLYA
jgi:hypothetical protein